jgi:hypothetical protein
MNRTKLVLYLMLAVGILSLLVDLLDGNGINWDQHYLAISAPIAGIFMRDGIKHEVERLK